MKHEKVERGNMADDGIRTIHVNRMKFDIFIPNSCKLSLTLTKLVHKLGTHTHCDTLHMRPCDTKPDEQFWKW